MIEGSEDPWEGGSDEPGDWIPENAPNRSDNKPRTEPMLRLKRREYSADGPITPSMKVVLGVLMRWGGPMPETAIKDLAILEGGARNVRVMLKALEARGMVDHYRPQLRKLPFRLEWRGLWILTVAGIKAAQS